MSVPTSTSLPPARSGRILVGVDGSPASIEALQWAGRIASATGAGIDAVCAWQYPASYSMAMGMASDNFDIDYAMILARAVDTAFGNDTPAGLRTLVREGYPAQVLLTLSQEDSVDMLVVGSRGHGGFVGLLIGSTSAYCAEHAACPVVVVHHRPATTQ